MIDPQAFTRRLDFVALWVKPAMEFLWLAAVFTVPLIFASPSLMGDGYSVPKITLYRSLVGLMAALLVIQWGLKPNCSGMRSRSQIGQERNNG